MVDVGLAAAAGEPNIKQKLQDGVTLNGRKYRNDIDGYNLLPYLSGKVKDSPRKDFIYVNDDGQVVAMRLGGRNRQVNPTSRSRPSSCTGRPSTADCRIASITHTVSTPSSRPGADSAPSMIARAKCSA